MFWAVLDGLKRTCVVARASGEEMPSLDLWANLLRALDNVAIDVKALPEMLRLSKRACEPEFRWHADAAGRRS